MTPATIIVPTWALNRNAIQHALAQEGHFDARDDVGDGTMRLTQDQAAWGEFETLESALIKAGIAFDRLSDAKYEYDAEMRCFRPAAGVDGGLDVVVKTLQDHDPVISLSSLAQLAATEPLTLDAIRSYLALPRETVAEWAVRHAPTGAVLS